MKQIFVIECRTGCSCCSNENHFRGPYETNEDATKRINFYKTSTGDKQFWPVCSQFSRRGSYNIHTVSVEELPDGRVILNGSHVQPPLNLIKPNPDGSINDATEWQDSEKFEF